VAWQRAVGLDQHAPAAVGGALEAAGERAGLDAGSPQHGGRFDELLLAVARVADAVLVDVLDPGVEAQLDAQLGKLFGGLIRQPASGTRS
jgi:hypothetical protein